LINRDWDGAGQIPVILMFDLWDTRCESASFLRGSMVVTQVIDGWRFTVSKKTPCPSLFSCIREDVEEETLTNYPKDP